MTVKELREALAHLPDTMPLAFEYDGMWTDQVALYTHTLAVDRYDEVFHLNGETVAMVLPASKKASAYFWSMADTSERVTR
jgi:hypothetical protein